jgi:hypothetical protein
MIRHRIHWLIAIMLVVMVISACVVRSRPARPVRGRPVYVVPAHDHGKHKGHDKHKHKHKKHH